MKAGDKKKVNDVIFKATHSGIIKAFHKTDIDGHFAVSVSLDEEGLLVVRDIGVFPTCAEAADHLAPIFVRQIEAFDKLDDAE